MARSRILWQLAALVLVVLCGFIPAVPASPLLGRRVPELQSQRHTGGPWLRQQDGDNQRRLPEDAVASNLYRRPGIELLLRQKLFDDAAIIAVGIVNEQFSSPRSLPDVNTTQPTPVLGDSSIVLTNVTLTRVVLDTGRTSVALGDGDIAAMVDNSTVEVEFNFELEQLRWPHVKSHGHALVVASECLVSAHVTLDVTPEGLVRMSVGDSEVVMGSLDIKISESGAAWLYEVLANIFKGNIKGRVAEAVRNAIQVDLPARANEIFASMPRSVNVSTLEVNTSFSGQIEIFSAYAMGHIEASVMGCPFSSTARAQAPLALGRQQGTSIFLLSTVPNCLSWAWFVTGSPKQWEFDRFDPDHADGPPEITNCSVLWSQAVPQVDEQFRNAPCAVAVKLDRAPAIRVGPPESPKTVEVTIKAVLEVSGQDVSGAAAVDHHLFSMIMSLVLRFLPGISTSGEDTFLDVSLDDAELIPELLDSSFATPVDIDRAKLVFNAALGANSEALENFVRGFRQKLPLLPHVSFVGTAVDVRQDEIVLSLDAAYSTAR
ncbi:hypothetical protein DFJ74DRAFT_641560 [Hyaloraphidium curvatum]|nr:hypothetical protein DFJ74DRAFT_641560 [Hyaloraphidium curvatum]